MYKPSKNPTVEELTKSYRDRNYRLSDLPYIIIDQQKRCIWCGDPLKSKHHATRYCTDKNCEFSVMAWANPQKFEGLFCLMLKQDWKCAVCAYDYREFARERFLKTHEKWNKTLSESDFIKYNYSMMYRIKSIADTTLRPEVDHIIPISKGGMALGLDNHQILCFTCHKKKTKIDNSGPRKKK